jgi:hypothetical protein
MAEKLKFVELDIDIEKLVQSSAKSLRHLQGLEDKQKSLKKSTKDLRQDMDDIRKAMNNPEIQKNTVEYGKLQQKLGDTHKEYVKTTEQLSKVQTGLKAARKEYNQNNKVLDAYAEKQRKQITVIKQTDGSINQIAIALSKNKEAYKSLNKEERENSEVGQKLLKLIQDQDKEYKELHNSIGNTGVNVGNYKDEVKKAIDESLSLDSILGGLLGRFKFLAKPIILTYNALKSYVVGQKGAAVATNATSKSLRLFRVALLLTGIGAIVVLLGSLVAYFSSTQKGINAVNKVLIPLKIIFQSLFGVLQNVGEAMVNAFSNPKKAMKDIYDFVKNNIINRFKAFAVILDGIVNLDFKKVANGVLQVGTGVEDVIGKTKNLAKDTGKFFDEAYNRGKRIAELQQLLSSGEADYILNLSKAKEEFKAQNKISEDQTKSLEVREAAAKRSIEIQKEINKLEDDRLSTQIELMKLQQSSNDTSDAERAELATLEAKRNESRTRQLEAETTQQNKLNGIRKQANTEAIALAKKRTDEALKESKTLLDIYIAEQGVKAKTLQEELAIAETVSKKKKEILKAELKAGKITQSEYNLAILELDNDLISKRAEIAVDIANRELQIFKDAHQSKLDANTFFTEELLNQETSRLDAISEKEREYHQKRLEQGVINQTEYNDAIKQVDEENRIAKEEAQLLRDEAKKEKEIIDLENKRAIDEENFNNQFAIESERLERERLQEVENAKKTGADVKLINDKYAAYQKTLDRDIADFKAEMNSQIFAGLKNLFGESSALGKLFAIAEITNTTALNAQKAFAQAAVFASNPLTAPLAVNAKIQGGVIVASGAAQIAKTVAPRAERGALIELGGKRHSQGGTTVYDEFGNPLVNAEEGEVLGVMNRNASRLFMNFNNEFRNRNLSTTPNNLATGNSIVQRSFTTNTSNSAPIDYDLLANKIGEANKQLPPNKLSLEYLNDFQSDLNDVELGASR